MDIHGQIDALVEAYLADGLAPDERDAFDRHLNECDECTTVLVDAHEFDNFVRGAVGPMRPAAGLEDRIVTSLRAEGMGRGAKVRKFSAVRRPRLSGVRVPLWVRAAGIAVLCVGLGVAVDQSSDAPMDDLFWSENQERGLLSLATAGPTDRAGFVWRDPEVPTQTTSGELGFQFGFDDARGEMLGRSDLARDSLGETRFYSALGDSFGRSDSGSGGVDNSEVGGEWDFSLGTQPDRGSANFGENTVKYYATEEFRRRSGVEDLAAELMPSRVQTDPSVSAPDGRLGLGLFGQMEDRRGGEVALGLGEPSPQNTFQDVKIIKTGSMEFEVVSFDAAQATVRQLATADGGFVATTTSSKLPNGKVHGTVVVRVPKDKFDEFLVKLAGLGELKNQNIAAQDITKQFVDLSSRLASKRTLEERLLQMLAEGQGELKDLLQVEKELGAVREQIEKVQGELNYFSNQIAFSTLTLSLREQDLGKPFEYVQTLTSNLGLVVEDADASYATAHDVISQAGGRILDANMTREKDGRATARIQAAVDAEAFESVKAALIALGDVILEKDVREQKPVGGVAGEQRDAPVRREQAVLYLTLESPAIVTIVGADLAVETESVEPSYEQARGVIEAAGGEILGGNLTRHTDGASGIIQATVAAVGFDDLVVTLKGFGEVTRDVVRQNEIEKKSDLRRELGTIQLRISTPAPIVEEASGLTAVFRSSVRGLVWSLSMLTVGVASAGPWVLLLIVGFWLYRWRRAKKAA